MTISSETRKAGPFLGTGAVSEYPFDFKVFAAADLLVVMADENGADTELVLNSDYTVTLNADQDASPGGEITLTTPLPVDHVLVITSDMEALQPTDLTNQGGFYPEVVEDSLDRQTILIQQLKEQVSRALKVSITSDAAATPDALIAELQEAITNASASAAAAAASAVNAEDSAFDAQAAATLTLGGYRNRILNGDFRVAQYGAVIAPVTIPAFTSQSVGDPNSAGGHVVDGWRYSNNSNAVLSVARSDGALPDGRTVKWLNATVSTSDASIAAGEFCFLRHVIPQEEMSDLFGRTFIIHGFVVSSVPGVHCVALRNAGLDRYYIGEINIAAAGVPQQFSIVVAGGLPSTGTWNTGYSGLEVDFVLAAGTDHVGTGGSWQTGGRIDTAAQVNALATVGNAFGLAEVVLEPGAVALPSERLAYADSLARCQRRYELIRFPMLQNAYNGGLGSIGAGMSWAVTKHAQPSVIFGTLLPEGGVTLVVPAFEASTSGVVQATAGTYSGAFAGNYYLLPLIGDARF